MTLRRRWGLAAVVAGVTLTAVGATRLSAAPAADFGTDAAPRTAVVAPSVPTTEPAFSPAEPSSPTPAVPGTTVATPAGPGTTDGGSPPTAVEADPATGTDAPEAGGPVTPAVPAADRPVEVRLDRLAVSAPIDEVFAVDGTLQVPEDPRRVGWWAASAWVGAAAGTTVLDGHVDSASAGVGFFVHLRDLVEGDLVTVTTASGRTVAYAVTARQTFPKSAPLPAALFDRSGPPTLVLVTCGGPFDRDRGSYEDNVAVTAVPVTG
ncbi:class F sortase [Nakamurella deserti]|uniref:class F sortase n=1 Tax=Nakamurella deserti TaxID=2164074 RepID=UPI000DBE01B3|nr:class F sortase [Nakamurella deserti]